MIYSIFFIICFLFFQSEYNLNKGEYDFIEINSNKKAKVTVDRHNNDIVLSVKMGLLNYKEIMHLKGDTLFLINRQIKLGWFGANISYKPYRIRMIFPLKEDTLFYRGMEISFAKKDSIENITSIMHRDTVWTIISKTLRDNQENISSLSILENGKIIELMFIWPSYFWMYRLLGFKSSHLIFKSNEYR